ncbi:MAG: class I SAM-dependent methyltransferase [Deltaproteobacteria bacterium]|jgi:SAM-dependent methyltransferase|nr:class I SAM-dependent methyltransferase [Deltaproteobacteria bacterium]
MAVELTLTPVCRLCGQGSLRSRLLFRAPASYLSGEFGLSSCDRCGAWQVNPYPGPKLCQSYFSRPDLWAERLDPDHKPISPLQRAEDREKEYRLYAQALTPLLPERGLALDVGAGTGLMLSLLPDSLPKLAVEPNLVAAEVARQRGLEVMREWAENLHFPVSSARALILNQTLDHLARPDLFLAKALNWLAPGGLLLISGLINPHSLAARVYGPGHRLWSPFHQIYPPLSAMSKVLAAYGLEIVRVWRPYFQTPFGSPLTLAKDSLRLLGALFYRPKGAVSPPWPGNSISLLARKNLLLKTLSAPSPQTAPLESLN